MNDKIINMYKNKLELLQKEYAELVEIGDEDTDEGCKIKYKIKNIKKLLTNVSH